MGILGIRNLQVNDRDSFYGLLVFQKARTYHASAGRGGDRLHDPGGNLGSAATTGATRGGSDGCGCCGDV